MSADVFRPSNGPLLLPSSISAGAPQRMDTFRKSSHGARPATTGGYRFGQLSHNSFFARHNPHPGRVRHIKGLLDVPICSVNDDGFVSNPRYAPTFPPNSYNKAKLNGYSKSLAPVLPANAVNVNSKLHPINTITGLQYFLGKPLNMRIFRENLKARPGISQVNETWRDELRALTEALGLKPPQPEKKDLTGRPRTQYSETTGRLLPPPSRAMSRGMSRGGSRMETTRTPFHDLGIEDLESEQMVMGLLCQILQTDDLGAVQQWLIGAGDREKALVLNMIQSALMSSGDYKPQAPTQDVVLEDKVIGDSQVNGDIDRLTLDPPTPVPHQRPPSRPRSVLRPPSRPDSRANQPPATPSQDPLVMRYTNRNATPIMEEEENARYLLNIPDHRPVTAPFQTTSRSSRRGSSVKRFVDSDTQTWTPCGTPTRRA